MYESPSLLNSALIHTRMKVYEVAISVVMVDESAALVKYHA